MTHEADEELLSAYLDGELTADEQAHVEQLLGENPAYRQLYDELRALRTSCEALPRYRLQEDLTRQVLRRAERAMLKGTGPTETPAAESGNSAQEFGKQENGVLQYAGRTNDATGVEPVRLRLPRGWRPWLWPALALAAGLLVMVFNPQPEREPRKVAMAPPADPADISIGAAAPAGGVPEAASDQDRIAQKAQRAENTSVDRAADGAEKAGSVKRESEQQAVDKSVASEQLRSPVEKQKGTQVEGLLESDRVSPAPMMRASEAGKAPQEPRNSPLEPEAAARAAVATPRAAAADKLGVQATQNGRAAEDKSAEPADAAKAAPAKIAQGKPANLAVPARPFAVDSEQKPVAANAAGPEVARTAAAAAPPIPAQAGAPAAAGSITLSAGGTTTVPGGTVFSNRGSSSLSAGAGGPRFTLRITPATAVPKGNDAKDAVATQQNGAAAQRAGEVPAGVGGGIANRFGANSGIANSGAPINNDGVLVVECQLRPQAAERGAFDELLAKNDITFESADAPTTAQLLGRQLAANAAAGAPLEDARKEVAAAQNDAPGKGAAPQPGQANRAQQQGGERGALANNQARRMQQGEGRGANFAFAGNAVVPIYVQASRQQIEATLADMQSRADEFVAVNVQPAANADGQQSLTAYNRAALSQIGRRESQLGQAANSLIRRKATGLDDAPTSVGQSSSPPPTALAPAASVGNLSSNAASAAPVAGAAPAAKAAAADGAPAVTDAAKNSTEGLAPGPALAGAAQPPQAQAASPLSLQGSTVQSPANSAQAQRIKMGFGSGAAPTDEAGSVKSGNANVASGNANVASGNARQDRAKDDQPVTKKLADKNDQNDAESNRDKSLPASAAANAHPGVLPAQKAAGEKPGPPEDTLRVLFLLQVAEADEPAAAPKPAK